MLNSVFITLPGKYVLQRKMEAITNNLANASTAGYKSSKISFTMALDEVQAGGGSGIALPHTTLGDIDSYIYFSGAPAVETGNNLDMAIQGDGFFVVTSPEGRISYTRNGQFTLDKDMKLVTQNGSAVMGKGGEITLNGKDIKVEDDGSIYVDGQVAGVLKIVDFQDKAALVSQGGTMFTNSGAENEEITAQNFTVKSGYYEASNVNTLTEMADMMAVVRAYESYSKVDDAINDVMTKLLNVAR
jgi:flagellar basal-body rod protein FlgF